MNKYYRPEIEEFHVDFEYERFIPTKNSTEEECWKKISLSVNYLTLEDIDDEIIEKEIRVKYLDKEDIESLGFRNIISTGTFIKEINKDKAIIDFQDWEYVVIYNFEDNKVFEGSIKNKSELKVLLKQLGI